jgi:sugar transferase (PEP-CTERM/EpsH1 system associated)
MQDLLFLAHRLPYPPDKGDKIRAYHVLRHLARKFRVHLGCFADEPGDLQYASRLGDYCTSVFVVPLNRRKALARGLTALAAGRSLSEAYFRDVRMSRWVAETMATVSPANVFVFCSAMAPYALPYASTNRTVLDMVDVDSEKWRAYAENAAWPISLLYARESRALLSLERRAAMTCERSFFVSQAEADTFLRAAPEASGRVGYFQNGVDLDYFNPARDFANPFSSECSPIVFTGTMDYRPNIEAVQWFAEEVFPTVRRAHPKAEFWIVGANPSPRVAKLAHKPAVRVTGRVSDVRPFVANACCIVAPLRIARGVQNKMLEAMAMARPVVATPAAFEGISAVPAQDVLIAETAPLFAQAVISVLSGAARGVGHRGRLCVEAEYDWFRNLQVLDGFLREGADPHRSRDCALSQNAESALMRTGS